MRMLKLISGNIRKDKIQNEEFRLKIGMAPIEKKMRESCLRWFGQMQRRTINALVRKSDLIQQGNERSQRKIQNNTSCTKNGHDN